MTSCRRGRPHRPFRQRHRRILRCRPFRQRRRSIHRRHRRHRRHLCRPCSCRPFHRWSLHPFRRCHRWIRRCRCHPCRWFLRWIRLGPARRRSRSRGPPSRRSPRVRLRCSSCHSPRRRTVRRWSRQVLFSRSLRRGPALPAQERSTRTVGHPSVVQRRMCPVPSDRWRHCTNCRRATVPPAGDAAAHGGSLEKHHTGHSPQAHPRSGRLVEPDAARLFDVWNRVGWWFGRRDRGGRDRGDRRRRRSGERAGWCDRGIGIGRPGRTDQLGRHRRDRWERFDRNGRRNGRRYRLGRSLGKRGHGGPGRRGK